MDRRQGFGSGLFGSSSGEIPVTSSVTSMSPYLNFDPAFLNVDPDSQFILPEGASHRRGRFELAFSQIGGSVCVGAGVGGVTGFLNGLKDTRAAQLAGPVRRTQMLNYITKKGASSAQTLGVIALMYSICGVVLCKTRGAEDELNTLAASTLTGLAYKSTAGLKRCLRGGAIGFGLGAVYCLYTSKDHVKRILGIKD
jgi:import inner membrane translocase subunit TIM23